MKNFISRQWLLYRPEDFSSFIMETAMFKTEGQVLNLETSFICEMGFEQLEILQAWVNAEAEFGAEERGISL